MRSATEIVLSVCVLYSCILPKKKKKKRKKKNKKCLPPTPKKGSKQSMFSLRSLSGLSVDKNRKKERKEAIAFYFSTLAPVVFERFCFCFCYYLLLLLLLGGILRDNVWILPILTLVLFSTIPTCLMRKQAIKVQTTHFCDAFNP